MSEKRVLVVGGIGYLGQHLLQSLSSEVQGSPYDVAVTYHSTPPPQSLLDALPPSFSFFQVDLRTGSGFENVSLKFGQPDVVVNCAALSVPRVCENDPDSAMSTNVPSTLVNWFSCFNEIYEGVKSFYKEDDETVPVNVYGKSKVAAEKYIVEKCSNFAILRSSIIFGPQTLSPVPKSLPIQWIDGVLSKGDKAEFLHDEYRCPVYVKDVVSVILTLTNRWVSDGKQMQMLLNLGGPDRVSRVQMAEVVADVRGYDTTLIKQVSASSVNRGVKSPADISMDITKLIQMLNIHPVTFRDGVKLVLAAEAKQ